MARKKRYANPAEQARAEGWKPGTVLYGGAVTVNGQRIESPRLAVITAIGEERLIARTRGTNEREWSVESFLTFSNRKWRRASEREMSLSGGPTT